MLSLTLKRLFVDIDCHLAGSINIGSLLKNVILSLPKGCRRVIEKKKDAFQITDFDMLSLTFKSMLFLNKKKPSTDAGSFLLSLKVLKYQCRN